MWAKMFLAVAGASSGCAVAVAALAFVNAIGIYPRMATKSRTGKYIVLYENIAGIGLVAGCVFSIFKISLGNVVWLLIPTGFFYGCFVGNLIMGLAEVIDVFPVLFHRVKLKTGLCVIILTVALGKLVGSLSYFLLRLWE